MIKELLQKTKSNNDIKNMKENLSNKEMRFGNTNFQITEVPAGMRKKIKEEIKMIKTFRVKTQYEKDETCLT